MDNEELKEAYLVMQEASGIKIGDTVKVLRKAADREKGWMNSWTPSMTKNIGKNLVVTAIGYSGTYLDGQGYPFFVLEKIKSVGKKNDIESFIDSCDGFGCQKENIKKLVELVLKEARNEKT